MKKYRLTNPFEHPKQEQASFMQLSKVLSKYQWLLLISVIIVTGLIFFFIGRYFGRRNKLSPRVNPYLPVVNSNTSSPTDTKNNQTDLDDTESFDPPLKV